MARVENAGLSDEAQQLIDSERDDAEHKMTHHFGVAAHAQHSAAELVSDPRIDALNGGALIGSAVSRL